NGGQGGGVGGGARTGTGARKRSAREGGRGGGRTPQGGRGQAAWSDRGSREGHCGDRLVGNGESARHSRRGCGRHCRATNRRRASKRRGWPSREQRPQALRTPMFEAEFWVAVAFVIFVGVLGYFQAHKRLVKSIDDRREDIKAEPDEARRLKAEAEALLASYRRKQQEAEREAETIVASAKAEAERLAGEAEAKIEEFVLRRTKMAESKI